MAKQDKAHKLTEEKLEQLEKRIEAVYSDAYKDLSETVQDYFESFRTRDKHQQELLLAGDITEEQYKLWRLNQIGRGKRFESLRDKIARRYTDANEVTISYVNDATPGIYSLNRNYSSYTIDKATDGGISFQDGKLNGDFVLFDEQTVKRLIVERPDLMPNYPKAKALKRGIDLKYGKKQITASVTSGILQGKSVYKIANDLQNRISDMNRTSAVRTARTAITSAQNAGRQDGFQAAIKMGIEMQKEWVATLDGRTRHSHRILDGKKVGYDDKFPNGCRYPGDPQGKPAEVYNCRCTMIAKVKDVREVEPVQRRVRDPKTGRNVLLKDMTYSEWERWAAERG